jgi:hypothetical protein
MVIEANQVFFGDGLDVVCISLRCEEQC